jgi:hypothetical protein
MTRPITILVAALGGEGGGVLADWLIEAALHEGFPAQKTSIPGVSQRTGATTYYVEIHPQSREKGPPAGDGPVPSPGAIDLMAASELVEAGRAMQNAFITPERTTLVAPPTASTPPREDGADRRPLRRAEDPGSRAEGGAEGRALRHVAPRAGSRHGDQRRALRRHGRQRRAACAPTASSASLPCACSAHCAPGVASAGATPKSRS